MSTVKLQAGPLTGIRDQGFVLHRADLPDFAGQATPEEAARDEASQRREAAKPAHRVVVESHVSV